jgi:Uma2 family endonuclease
MDATSDIRTRRWKRVEYERLIECGIFQPDERLELIDGLLLLREPQSSPHMAAIRLAERALTRAFGAGWDVRGQGPIALDDDSEPEPDVSVVRGDPRDYVDHHPSDPVLVVEVSLGRVAFDRGEKAGLYARAGVPEYWIVNLVERALEVRRRPVPSGTEPYGATYDEVAILGPNDSVTPLAVPASRITVADLLP